MNTDQLVALIPLLVVGWFWVMCIWGGWAEKTYDRWQDSNYLWNWLRLFKQPAGREDCIAQMRLMSWIGLLLVALGVVAVLVLH